MSATQKIKLPDEEEMRKRLLAISDSQPVIDGFYPRMLRMAGGRITLAELAFTLFLQMFDYTEHLTDQARLQFDKLGDEFLKALIDDEQLHATAIHELDRFRNP